MYSYNFNLDLNYGLNLPSEIQYGPLAQEFQEVFPEMVTPATQPQTTDDDGNVISEGGTFLAVNITQLVPHLVSAIQEQQVQIDELKVTLDLCCAGNDTKRQDVEENSINNSERSAFLFQNTPNPHQGYTVIRYFVPEVANNVELQFFDMGGQLVKTIPINQLGFSEVQLNASDMANGMYTYGLMVDGKIIDMKKMIKE